VRSHKKFGLDRFSRFDFYWKKQTDKQRIYIEVTCNLCSRDNEESCQNSTLLKDRKTTIFSQLYSQLGILQQQKNIFVQNVPALELNNIELAITLSYSLFRRWKLFSIKCGPIFINHGICV